MIIIPHVLHQFNDFGVFVTNCAMYKQYATLCNSYTYFFKTFKPLFVVSVNCTERNDGSKTLKIELFITNNIRGIVYQALPSSEPSKQKSNVFANFRRYKKTSYKRVW